MQVDWAAAHDLGEQATSRPDRQLWTDLDGQHLCYGSDAHIIPQRFGQFYITVVVQRFLLVILPVLSTLDLKGGAVAMSRISRHSQERFILACGIVENFPSCRPSEFRSGEIRKCDE